MWKLRHGKESLSLLHEHEDHKLRDLALVDFEEACSLSRPPGDNVS